MTEKRYQLRQEQLDYPIVNFCCDLVDTENNDKVICSFDNGIGTSKMVDLLNEKEERIKELEEENAELRQDNDIKFWKLQCMHYFNSISLFMSEISRAIKKGYEVSEQFQEYLDELKEKNKEIKEKNKRLFGDSE